MFEKQINSLQFCTLLVYISFKDCFSNSVFSVINIQSKLFFFFVSVCVIIFVPLSNDYCKIAGSAPSPISLYF